MPVIDAPSVVWIAVAIIAALIEVTIPQFGVIFVSLAALSAAFPAWLGFGPVAQIAVFVVVLALSLFLLRPRIIAKLSTAPGVPSRTDTLLGCEGVVTYDIDPAVGAGRVNVSGQDWAARAPTPLATGTRVRVSGADGIVLEVRPT